MGSCQRVLPYISHIGMLRFRLKTGIDLPQSGKVFEGTTGVYERSYRFNSK